MTDSLFDYDAEPRQQLMKLRRARGEKLCDMCGRAIKKGERYWREEVPKDHLEFPRIEHISCPVDNFTAQERD